MAEAPTRGETRHLLLATNVALPGVYAWLTTVAHPAFARGVGGWPRAAAYAALLCLAVGAVLIGRYPGVARGVGVIGFVASSVLTWILLGHRLDPERLDSVRAACGALGWAIFALGWGATERFRPVPADDSDETPGKPLAARGRLPRAAVIAVALGLVAALAPWLAAWQVKRAEHALLAHGAALVSAIAIVIVASHVAIDREQKAARPAPRHRVRPALGSLSALAFVLAAGVVWLLLK
jgi:hypothetical protein